MNKVSQNILLQNYVHKRPTGLLGILMAYFIGVLALSLVLGLNTLKIYTDSVPTEEQIRELLADNGENTKIFDRHGKLLYEFKSPVQDREYARFDEIPTVVVAAALAAEDRDFFYHDGFDYLGTIKGLFSSIAVENGQTSGGSTITQQLIKQTVLTSEKTIDRKIKEAIITLKVEQDYSKEQILEYYLNSTTYGGRVRGVKTAAEVYFSKRLDELSLPEAAMLMGLVQSPGEYSPLFASDLARAEQLTLERRNYVLSQVAANPKLLAYLNTENIEYLKLMPGEEPNLPGEFTAEVVSELLDTEIKLKPAGELISAPHWVFYIRDLLLQDPYSLTLDQIYTGGYRIYTTLDLRIQRLAERKLSEGVESASPYYGFQNGALVVIDANNGDVLAMVGSKGYNLPADRHNLKFDPKVNVVTARQALGSSLKPWVAYLGFNKRIIRPYSVVKDEPKQFAEGYEPKNWDGKFEGEMTLVQALLRSRNLPFVRLADQLGARTLPDFMSQIGYQQNNQYGLSAAIGGVDESLLDHTAAYSGLANGGTVYEDRSIIKITDRDGNELFSTQRQALKDLNRDAVNTVNSILGDKRYGFGANASKFIGRYKLAGKTGTSDNNRDTYYIGYGPRVVAGIWVGNNDNSPMNGNAYGVNTALPIWNSFMRDFFNQFPEFGEIGTY